MQTFLPYASFKRSLDTLDNARLGKQRVECLQVLNVFAGVREGWGDHPITRMWRGHEAALLTYTVDCCRIWVSRGFADTVEGKVRALAQSLGVPGGLDHDGVWQLPVEYTTVLGLQSEDELPPWFGSAAFHASHRSNLLRKALQYRDHHSDVPHERHPRCDGNPEGKPHTCRGVCDPHAMLAWYVPRLPTDTSPDLPYVWPV